MFAILDAMIIISPLTNCTSFPCHGGSHLVRGALFEQMESHNDGKQSIPGDRLSFETKMTFSSFLTQTLHLRLR